MHWMRMSALILALAITPQFARAQASDPQPSGQSTAQAGSKNSNTTVTTVTEKEKTAIEKDAAARGQQTIIADPAKPDANSSHHLVAPSGPPPEEVNRKALEENAGPDAGKLLLRSTPGGAQVFINDAYVGHAPMLLIVPPGNYKIEMRGGRLETGMKTVGLLPNQTQEVALTLKQLYPSAVPMK